MQSIYLGNCLKSKKERERDPEVILLIDMHQCIHPLQPTQIPPATTVTTAAYSYWSVPVGDTPFCVIDTL